MEFELSEEQQQIKMSVREFAGSGDSTSRDGVG